MKALLLSIMVCPLLLLGQGQNPRLTPLVRAVNKAMPATVVIHSRSIDVEQSDNLESKLKLKLKNLGTGVVVDESGLIITNEHVIRNTENIWISTFNNKELPARVLYTSKKEDLAILQMDCLLYTSDAADE